MAIVPQVLIPWQACGKYMVMDSGKPLFQDTRIVDRWLDLQNYVFTLPKQCDKRAFTHSGTMEDTMLYRIPKVCIVHLDN